MQDPFGRIISYLRVSVTDRCDFRCVYCMEDDATFLPKSEVLTLEELERLCGVFIRLGVRKIRLTGGEPLVARNVMFLVDALGARLGAGLEELTLTTNGSQLAKYAPGLKAAGMRRINVSLDTLDEQKFAAITRHGRLAQVLEGIEAAHAAGLRIKINMVALKGVNDGEFDAMIAWCGARGFDLSLIETMPVGEVVHREESYLPLAGVRADLATRWTLLPSTHVTGGPSRYVQVKETGAFLGFITPLTEHFCDSCNRVRLTRAGRLYLCLGHDDSVDFRAPLREGADDAALEEAVRAALRIKPRRHEFEISRVAVARPMSATGG
jgi:cyclic pyranopterin phosphate synthase